MIKRVFLCFVVAYCLWFLGTSYRLKQVVLEPRQVVQKLQPHRPSFLDRKTPADARAADAWEEALAQGMAENVTFTRFQTRNFKVLDLRREGPVPVEWRAKDRVGTFRFLRTDVGYKMEVWEP